MNLILVINPGSTSTKVAIYRDGDEAVSETLLHSKEEIAQFAQIADQLAMRTECVRQFLTKSGVALADLQAIVSRGGMLPPVRHGAYQITEHMVDVLLHRPAERHASNLGAPIAFALAGEVGIPSYIYDSVSVDELADCARPSGLAGYDRQSFSHVLNMRATARKALEAEGQELCDANVIVAHLGGGVSLSMIAKGKLVDIVAGDEAPFSSERAGAMPMYQTIALVRKEGVDALARYQAGQGGLVSYIGSNDLRDLLRLQESGDANAKLIFEAMVLQIAKAIWQLAAVTCGDVDVIVLTGGMVHSPVLREAIAKRCQKLAKVTFMPGEHEMEALALGCMRVLSGEETALVLAE